MLGVARTQYRHQNYWLSNYFDGDKSGFVSVEPGRVRGHKDHAAEVMRAVSSVKEAGENSVGFGIRPRTSFALLLRIKNARAL